LGEVAAKICDRTRFLGPNHHRGKTAWTIAAILNYLKESLKQQSVEGQYAYILWSAETADNVYEVGTDTFVVRDGKIVTQSFTGKITPKS
jgi:branched-subunit amino acid aminotransferase/4-amino-4-deoxychorismate lyase